jgi:hypothetical protein
MKGAAPDGFFLNTRTGQMLGTFEDFDDDKTATQNYSITLQAVDGSGIHQDLETIEMHVRYPDIEVDGYGPHNTICKNNGTRVDGLDGNGDQYDQSYDCKCTGSTSSISYSGDNCEVAVHQGAAPSDGGDARVVGGEVGGAFVGLFLIGLAVYRHRVLARQYKAFDYMANIFRLAAAGEMDDTFLDANQVVVPREVKRSHVTMIGKIGSGAFGDIWKAMLDESASGGVPGYMVAVKIIKKGTGEGADDLHKEASVMAQLAGHPNLVALVGVVTSGLPLFLLLSLCEHGSLLSVLQQQRNLKEP